MPAPPAFSKQVLVQSTPAAVGEIAINPAGQVQVHNGAAVDLYEPGSLAHLYVQSRGQNLITNGSGLLGSNTNFSSFVFDAVETYSGGGSMRANLNKTIIYSDELIPVDPGQTYLASMWAKSGDVGGANYNAANAQFVGIVPCDIDGNQIIPWTYAKLLGSTDTTLAVALNPGDTTMTLTSAAGWHAGGSYQSTVVWYGYANAKGYTYPNYTYTRFGSYNYGSNASLGTWAAGGISGNVVTLRVPWAGPALAAGAAVRNTDSGGTYKYILINNNPIPNQWTYYSGQIGGIDTNGTQNLNMFPYGCTAVKLMYYINYHGAADNNVRCSNQSFTVNPVLAQGTPTRRGAIAINAAGQILVHNGTSVDVYGPAVPVGSMHLWAGAAGSPPAGYLTCDGSSLLQSSYPALYAVIGVTYGSVDGTHFTLPDLRTRIPVGVSAGDPDFGGLGQTGGAKTVAGGSHSHGVPSHNHPLSGAGSALISWSSAGLISLLRTVSGRSWTSTVKSGATAVSLAGDSTAQTGGVDLQGNTDSVILNTGSTPPPATSVLQPFIAVNYLIKT